MNRQQRQELLKQLDRRVAMIGAPGDPLITLAAAAIRDLQEKLDNANEASMDEYYRMGRDEL